MSKILKHPRHEFGLNKTFVGRYKETSEDESYHVFENETGLHEIPAYDNINKAVEQIQPETELEITYFGNGEFRVTATEM